MAGRPAISKDDKLIIKAVTKEIFSEITKKSGKKPAELEEFFSLRHNKEGEKSGRYWSKLQAGDISLTERVALLVIELAVKNEWLDKKWMKSLEISLQQIADSDNFVFVWRKIDKHVVKIIEILTTEAKGSIQGHMQYIDIVFEHLVALYLKSLQKKVIDIGAPPEEVEKVLRHLIRTSKALLQKCSTELEKQ